jgi:nitrilase
MSKTRIAAAQLSPVFLNKQKTVDKACFYIEKAAKKSAKLIVFPEAFIPAYPDWIWITPGYNKPVLNKMYTLLLKNSVSVPDAATKQISAAAKKNKINVVIGVNERNSDASNASLFNSLLFFNDKGKLIGRHRKLIPTGSERTVWAQGNGETLKVYDTSIGKIGGLICWENYMPLARASLYTQGVQIFTSPTWDSSESWQISMRSNAKEGGMFLISCCQAIAMTDFPDKFEFKALYPGKRTWINKGNSCIIDPKGNFVAGPVIEKEEIIYADIDLDLIVETKCIFDVAGHYSRPDVFELKIKE